MSKKKHQDNELIEKIKTLPNEIIFEIYSFCVPITENPVKPFIVKPPCLTPCLISCAIGNLLITTSYSIGYMITGIAWGLKGEYILINSFAGSCGTCVMATGCYLYCKENHNFNTRDIVPVINNIELTNTAVNGMQMH